MYKILLRSTFYTIITLLFFACSNTGKVANKLSTPVVKADQRDEMVNIKWTTTDNKKLAHWKVYFQYGKKWSHVILDRNDDNLQLPPHNGKYKLNSFAVTAVDRRGKETVRSNINPDVLTIIPRSGWEANEAKPYKQHVPVQITVHHEGGKILTDTMDAAKRIKNIQVWGMGKDRNWTDIPYHFLVAPDGTVYEGRVLNTVGETNTEYDPSGHLLICFLGNYQQQELNDHLLDILTRLIAYFCKKYNIPAETIASHRDHSTQTTCPGKNIYLYFENGYVKKRVIELLQEK